MATAQERLLQTLRTRAERPAFVPQSERSQSTLGDIPLFAEKGVRELVGSTGAIPEAVGAATGIRSLEEAGQRFRRGQAEKVEREITPRLSDVGRKVSESGFVDDVVRGDTPLVPFLVGKTAELLPGTVAGGAAGLGIKAAIPAIGKGAAFAAGEAAVSAPGGAAAQAENIDRLSLDDLLKTSDTFRKAYQENAQLPAAEREAAARSAVKAGALTTGGLSTALAVTAGSALAGKVLPGATGGVFGDDAGTALGVIKGTTQGFKQEAVQETAQSALESIAGDLTTATFVDPEAGKLDTLISNALKAAAEGAVLGGTVGGTIGAVQGVVKKVASGKLEKAQEAVDEINSEAAAAKSAVDGGAQVEEVPVPDVLPKTDAEVSAREKAVQDQIDAVPTPDTSLQAFDDAKISKLNTSTARVLAEKVNTPVDLFETAKGDLKHKDLLSVLPGERDAFLAGQTGGSQMLKASLEETGVKLKNADVVSLVNALNTNPDSISRSLLLADLVANTERGDTGIGDVADSLSRQANQLVAEDQALSEGIVVEPDLQAESSIEAEPVDVAKAEKPVVPRVVTEVDTTPVKSNSLTNQRAEVTPVAEQADTTVSPADVVPQATELNVAPQSAAQVIDRSQPNPVRNPEVAPPVVPVESPVEVKPVDIAKSDNTVFLGDLGDVEVSDPRIRVKDLRAEATRLGLKDLKNKNKARLIKDVQRLQAAEVPITAPVTAALTEDQISRAVPTNDFGPIEATAEGLKDRTPAELNQVAFSLGIDTTGLSTRKLKGAIIAAPQENVDFAVSELQPLTQAELTEIGDAEAITESLSNGLSANTMLKVLGAPVDNATTQSFDSSNNFNDVGDAGIEAELASVSAEAQANLEAKLADITAPQRSMLRELLISDPELLEYHSVIAARDNLSVQTMLDNINQDKIVRASFIGDVDKQAEADAFDTQVDAVLDKVFSDAEVEAVLNDYSSFTDEDAVDVDIDQLPDTRASRNIDSTKVSSSLTTSQVKSAIGRLQSVGKIKIDVVENITGLPAAGQRYLKDNNLEAGVRGLFMPGATAAQDKVFLVSSNITSPQEAVFVALHEAVHRGLRKVFGNQLTPTLLKIHNTNATVRDRVASLRAATPQMAKVTAIEEVLADMARERSTRQLSGFEKIVDAVNKFLVAIGIKDFKATNRIVEEIVSGAKEAGLQADIEILGNGPTRDTSDIRASRNPTQGPAELFDRTDGVLRNVVTVAENNLPDVKGWIHRKNLYFSTGSHIGEFYGRILGGTLKAPMLAIQDANNSVSAIVAKMNKDTSLIDRKMNALSTKDQGTLNELMGESTRLGIFPNKPFADQPWLRGTKSDVAINKRRYNELVQKFKKSKAVADVYMEALAHNERDFNMTFASLLKNMAFSFGAPETVWKRLDPLQALSVDTATRKNFDTRLKEAEAWMTAPGNNDAAAAFKSMSEFRTAKVQGPYFSLGRYGSYFVSYTINQTPESRQAVQNALDATGQREASFVSEDADRVNMRFEKEGAWTTQNAALRSLLEAGHIDNFKTGKLEENSGALDSVSPKFIQDMLGRIDLDNSLSDDARSQAKELIRRTFVDMMPEVAGSKQLARRKGVPGYSLEMRRSFVKRSASTAFFVAHSTVRPETSQAFNDMRREITSMQQDPSEDERRSALATDVLNHLEKRQANSMSQLDESIADQMSALGFTMFLASNVPYIISNLAQPFQTTLPVVGGRHGFTKTAGAMIRAGKLAGDIIKDTIQDGYGPDKQWSGILDAHISIERSNLSDPEKQAMNAFIDSGNLEFTQAHGLGRVAEGSNENLNTTVKALGAMSHYSEAFNRTTAGLAAFNLELEKLRANKSDTRSDEVKIKAAIKFGSDTIEFTQFNYDPENRGYAFSKDGIFGRLTPLFTAFQQFNMQMMQLLAQLTMQSFNGATPEEKAAARKGLAGLLATSATLAGVMGLPFVSVIAFAYNGLSDDDDPRDMRLDVQNFMAEMFGADAAQAITHGPLDRVTGGTFSTRLSLAEILPFSKFLEDRREFSDKIDSGAMSMLGPSIGAAVNIITGGSKMLDGDVYKGLAMMLPAALQGPVKTADLVNNGYTDFKGNKLPIEADNWDVFLQSFNITPSVKTELQRNVRSNRTVDRLAAKRKSELGRAMADAIENNDFEAQQRVGAEITQFLQENPDRGNVDVQSILKGRQTKLDVAAASRTGVGGNKTDIARLMRTLQGSTSTNLQERITNGL
jgi:hypothetical protein